MAGAFVLFAGGGALLLAGTPALGQQAEAPQAPTVVESAVSIASQPGSRAALEIELDDGASHRIAFEGGTVRVDDRRVGSYAEGGALETAWREFLRLQAGREPAGLGPALREWEPAGLTGEEAQAGAALRERIDAVLSPPEPEPAAPAAESVDRPDGGRLSIAPGGISFEALARQLEGLRASLEGLGEAAAGADERLALIVHDDFAVGERRTVDGNLALLGGELSLAGTVRGDVLVLDGTLRLRPSARVEGDVLQVGGSVEQEGGRIGGELTALRSLAPSAAPAPPATPRASERSAERARAVARAERSRQRGFFQGVWRNFGRAMEGLVATGSAFLGLGILGLIAVYFARPRLEMVADTTRRSFGRSFALGFAGQVLFFPALLVMVVLVITWLVIPFFLLAVILAAFGGYLAVAHGIGEIFARRRYRYEWLERLRRSNSYYYVLSGLALLLLPFAVGSVLWVFGGLAGFLRGLVLFVAVGGTWVLATAGFGAVLLTRGGSRPEVGGTEDWMTAPAGAEAGGGSGA